LSRLTDALAALLRADGATDAASREGMEVRLAALGDRVEVLEREREELARELERQRLALRDRRRVDLVNFGRISVFLYEGDLAHDGVAEPARGYGVAEHEAKLASLDLRDAAATAPQRPPRDQLDVTKVLFEHFWELGREPDYLDVGANYAVLSLAIGDFIRAAGRTSRVIAFEPGTSCDLARYSTRLNRLEDIVRIERLAVSDRPGLAMMFHEAGHTENNRIVNRMPETEALSFVVETTSIDHYLAAQGEARMRGDYVVKIDTQASEHLVLAGMERTRAQGSVAMIVELDPHNLQYQVDCERFLDTLAEGARIFEIAPTAGGGAPDAGPGVVPLDEARRRALPGEVLAREIAFTDLVVVPDDLPQTERLVERLQRG